MHNVIGSTQGVAVSSAHRVIGSEQQKNIDKVADFTQQGEKLQGNVQQ